MNQQIPEKERKKTADTITTITVNSDRLRLKKKIDKKSDKYCIVGYNVNYKNLQSKFL